MTKPAEYSDNTPEEWSELTARADFEVYSKPIGKLKASVSGPTKTVAIIAQVATGTVMMLGALLALWVGATTTSWGWFAALAALMAGAGAILMLRQPKT